MRRLIVYALLPVALLSACGPKAVSTGLSSATVAAPTILLAATDVPAPAAATAPALSFVPATYQDQANGFELEYPADWTSSPNTQIGSRGSQALLLSPGASAENLPDGATRITITIYQWDPKGDLTAYADHRKSAWEGSLSTVEQQLEGDLPGGRAAVDFVVRGPDGATTFVLLTTLGEQYLEIAGEGDLALVQEVAHTLRPLGPAQ